MNNRERFLNIFGKKPIDRVFNMEIALWPQTAYRWVNEGMPLSALDIPAGASFEEGIAGNDLLLMTKKPMPFFRQLNGWLEMAPLNGWKPLPAFEEKVLAEDERSITIRDSTGNVVKSLKEGSINGFRLSMDQHLDFPVKGREDFREMKKRYIANMDRLPKDWDVLCKKYNNPGREFPLSLFGIGDIGFYSQLRRWMGTENACCIFYEDPALTEEMVEFIGDYTIELISIAVKSVKKFDMMHIFEDMCFNNGPLVSPGLFKKYLVPAYRKIVDEAKKYGIEYFLLDCDGDIKDLMPLWMDSGINIMMPLEVKAGADPFFMRKEFGNDLGLIGGIPKYELTKSKAEIEKCVRNTLGHMLPIGAYIPTLDHSVPPDVPLENFQYYLEIKEKCLAGEL